MSLWKNSKSVMHTILYPIDFIPGLAAKSSIKQKGLTEQELEGRRQEAHVPLGETY